jgi:hypothetical protein
VAFKTGKKSYSWGERCFLRQQQKTNISETSKFAYERVFRITHNELSVKKLAVKWISKCMNADQQPQHPDTFAVNFKIVWPYSYNGWKLSSHYDLEPKSMSKELKH